MKRKRFFFRLLGILAILLLILAAAATSGVLWLNGFLRSQSLTDTLSRTVSKALDVEGKFPSIAIEMPSAASPGFAGLGPRRLREVRADDIDVHLDLAALLRRQWRISDLDIARATLAVDPAASAPPPSKTSGPSSDSASSSGDSLSPGQNAAGEWWRRFLPNSFHLARVHVDRLDLQWRSGLPPGSLNGTAVSARNRSGQRWNISAEGGATSIAGQPPIALSSASIEYQTQPSLCTIRSLRANIASGTIEVSGTVLPALDLEAIVRGVDIAPWLNAAIAAQFSGRVRAEIRITSGAKAGQPPDVAGSFGLEQAMFTNHPALGTLATATGIADYKTLRFDEVRSDFMRNGERLDFSNLVIESRGLLRLQGAGHISGDKIRATIEVGLPSRAFSRLPGAASEVFKTERGGYRWATVRLDGPLSNPKNDLITRLIAAPFNLVLAGITYPITDFVPNAAREATSGAGNILKGAVGVVGGAAKAVTTGKTDGLTDGAGNVVRGAGGILNSINPFRKRETRQQLKPEQRE